MTTKNSLGIILALALAAWLGACAEAPRQESRYCYKTLAQNDCYATPQDGQEYRLTGVYQVPIEN